MGLENVTSPDRDLVSEAQALRLQVLNTALLIAVVVGAFGTARTILDAIELGAWRVVGMVVTMYAGFLVLFFGKRIPYKARALCFLGLLYIVGVAALLSVGYLAAPVLVLAGQSVLASVLFGRRVTLINLALNVLALLGVGAALSTGIAEVETMTFYAPSVFMNWLRVAAIFAVFCSVAVVGVDVITNHLHRSLRDQAELIENLRGAVQLHEEAELHRRAAESRLRDTQRPPGPPA